MLAYKVIAKNKALDQQWELPFERGMVEWNLNDVGVASLTVSQKYLAGYLSKQGITLKDLFESGWLNNYIYYGDDQIFAGFFSNVVYSKIESSFTVELGIKSWLAYFENQLYSGSFSNTDAGNIAWQCIDAVNDIGIIQGTITATKNRDRTYDDDDVAKIIKHLSNNEILDGFEFEIGNNKILTVASRIGSDKPAVVFDEHNIIEFYLQVGLVGQVFNYGKILGAGIGDTQLSRTYDAGQSYVDSWYRLKKLFQAVNVVEAATLDDKVKKYIEDSKNPVRLLSLKVDNSSPLFTEYSVGDGVRINLPEVGIDEIKRIKKKILTFGSEEFVELQFL